MRAGRGPADLRRRPGVVTPRQGTTPRDRGPSWQPGLLSLPLPEGTVLCLRCPWADHSDHDAGPGVEHTRQTRHPTIYQPSRTRQPTTEEAPNP